MLQFVQDPQDKAVLTGVAIQNLEGEGLQDIKAYWRRKMVAMGVTKPTDEKAEMDEALANEKPDAQTTFLLAEAEKSAALAKKAEADTLLALRKAPRKARPRWRRSCPRSKRANWTEFLRWPRRWNRVARSPRRCSPQPHEVA